MYYDQHWSKHPDLQDSTETKVEKMQQLQKCLKFSDEITTISTRSKVDTKMTDEVEIK